MTALPPDPTNISQRRLTVSEMLASMETNDDEDPREDKPWPESEDCPTCDGRADGGASRTDGLGRHRFGCTTGGVRRLCLPASRQEPTP